MTTYLFSLVLVYSGVSSTEYTDLSFGQCIDRMMREQDAIDIVRRAYPNLDLRVSCVRQD